MELGRRFDMPAAVQYADNELGYRIMPSILRLQYGLICQNPSWVSRAFFALMGCPLYTLATSDIALVTPAIYAHIAATRNLIADYRFNVVSKIPAAVHGERCANTVACTHAWELGWLKGWSRRYLHPDPDKYVCWATAETEFNKVHFPGMSSPCASRTKDAVSNSGIFAKELLLIERAIDALSSIPIVNLSHTISEAMLIDGEPPLVALRINNPVLTQ